jgi:hypothetical protein
MTSQSKTARHTSNRLIEFKTAGQLGPKWEKRLKTIIFDCKNGGLLCFLIGQTGKRIYLIMQNKEVHDMVTPKMIDDFMSINIETVDVGKLTDISTLELDNSLSKEKRLAYILEKLKNPFCFRYGDMGIKLEFDDNAPPIQEVLANFLIRKKSGL